MRIHSIDYLRGIMALSVVLYHFSGLPDASSLLGRLGVYAVSSFYVISGMALFLAHKRDRWSVHNYCSFMLRRFARLAPVYWLAMVIFTLYFFIFADGPNISTWKYIQNFLLIFGVTNPTDYIIMGGWSIGNEVVFYLFFPLFIFLAFNRWGVFALSLVGIALLLYCAFYYMHRTETVSGQWARYINPLNQIYFFIFGVVAARLLLTNVGGRKKTLSAVIIACFLFMSVYPVSGDQINIVTGMNKIVFTSVIVILSSAFFLLGDLSRIRALHVPLKFLGDISYTIYLLHGVALMYFQKIVMPHIVSHMAKGIAVLTLIAFLMLVSWICHIYIERPVIALGKRFTMRSNEEERAVNTQ